MKLAEPASTMTVDDWAWHVSRKLGEGASALKTPTLGDRVLALLEYLDEKQLNSVAPESLHQLFFLAHAAAENGTDNGALAALHSELNELSFRSNPWVHYSPELADTLRLVQDWNGFGVCNPSYSAITLTACQHEGAANRLRSMQAEESGRRALEWLANELRKLVLAD